MTACNGLTERPVTAHLRARLAVAANRVRDHTERLPQAEGRQPEDIAIAGVGQAALEDPIVWVPNVRRCSAAYRYKAQR